MGFPPHAVLHRWLESYGHRLPGAGDGAGLLKEAQGNLGDNEEVLGFFFFSLNREVLYLDYGSGYMPIPLSKPFKLCS